MFVDPKCHELAVHFLEEEWGEGAGEAPEKQELAEWIQHHIDVWFYPDDRDRADRLYVAIGRLIEYGEKMA